MRDSDKMHVLDFLSGETTIKSFEAWLYNDQELEIRLGSDFYFDLVNLNFRNKDVVHVANKTLIGTHIEHDEFISFRYIKALRKAGWYEGRKINEGKNHHMNALEEKNAWNIIDEFGGLELQLLSKADYWTPRNILFPEKIERIIQGEEYGLNKTLICIAHIDNYNSAIYIDDENNFYQLDDITNVELYKFKGKDFSEMIKNLLGLDEEDNFTLIGRLNKKNSRQRI